MVVTEDVKLPTIAELDTNELNLSATTLMSAGPFVGKKCEGINNEFMLCRQESGDARACIGLGKQVTSCALNVFREIKHHCLEEFNQYSQCVDKSSGDYSFRHCRKTQAIFDKCMLDKVSIERPDFGYFTRGRVHKTATPAPPAPPCPCHPKVPDATPSLPDSRPRYPARLGARNYWITE